MKTLKLFLLVSLILLGNFIIVESSFVKTSTFTGLEDTITQFSTNILLTTSDDKYPEHVEPSLAIGENDQLFVGWKEAQTPISAGLDVSFSSSIDNGLTWSTPISMPSNISKTNYKSDPWLVIHDNIIYYSYLDYFSINSNITQITLAKSIDGGQTWVTSKASANKYFADKETFIVSPNGTIFLVYDDVDVSMNLTVVKFSKSTDGGKIFEETKISDASATDILGPYPAKSSNQTIFVSWLNIIDSTNVLGDIFWDYSTDQGSTFHTDRDLNPETNFGTYIGDNTQAGKSTLPVMKFDSKDRLYILWTEFNGKWKVYLRYSDDFGKHWSDKISVHENPLSSQWLPDMAIDSNDEVHLVWYEELNSQYRPYYKTITFSGNNRSVMTSSEVIAVANAFTSSDFTRPGDYCALRVDSNDIPHIVWTDGRSGHLDIFYAHGLKTENSSSNLNISGFTVTLFPSIAFAIVIKYKKRKRKNS